MGGRRRRPSLPPRSAALSAAASRARSLRGFAILLGTAAAVFTLDHLTKWLVSQTLPLGGQVWRGAPVSITHVVNRGAAFGLFPQFQWLYLIVAAIVVAYILFAGHRFGTTWYRRVLLGLILGGAVSNGVDRLLQGYVVDFIDLHWWPVFNVADSAIVIGILLTVLAMGRRPVAPPAAAS